MPIAHIRLTEERSLEIKKLLIHRVTAALVDAGCGPIERIRVLVYQTPEGNSKNTKVEIFLIEGRSEEIIAGLAKKISSAVGEAGGGPVESMDIGIRQVPSGAWGIAGKPASELRL